jgi:hypothetical protein
VTTRRLPLAVLYTTRKTSGLSSVTSCPSPETWLCADGATCRSTRLTPVIHRSSILVGDDLLAPHEFSWQSLTEYGGETLGLPGSRFCKHGVPFVAALVSRNIGFFTVAATNNQIQAAIFDAEGVGVSGRPPGTETVSSATVQRSAS